MRQTTDPLGYAVGAGPGVLLLHSWWGLTDSFRTYADRLAAAGFAAGCADLYAGALAHTPEEARDLRSRPRREPMYRTLMAAGNALLERPGTIGDRLALIGFSMGGHWAMWLAQRPDFPVDVVVSYYAARSVRPGTAPKPVLAHFAEIDEFVGASARRAMDRSLERAGWPHRFVDHPGTRHWFAESAEAAYDNTAADAAFALTLALLRERRLAP